jgi:lipid II:glycine glycyltransferase (peptidoglycan interpeptide bridge formation enzyme)
MSNWQLYDGDVTNWEDRVSHIENSTYLHDDEWAKHLENLGWTTCRWHHQQDGESIAFLQGFLKRYPFGVGVLWFPDWIIGDYKLSHNVTDVLRKSLSLRFLTIRIRSHHQKNNKELALLKRYFSYVSKPFDSGLTMQLDLSISVDELHQGLSKNWRRNLKRSNKLDYEIVEVRDIKTIVRLYKELGEAKGLGELFSFQQIESLMNSYAEQIVVIGARTPDGVVQAIRGAIIRNHQAIDIFAAANAFSRKHYLSYALCWELVNRCQSLGCHDFDFNGVDPENNMGVYNFKKGTGARLVETLGEFEYSNSFIMKKLVNIASRWRS